MVRDAHSHFEARYVPKILILEDDILLRKTLVVFLKKNNFTVQATGTVDEALAWLKNEHFDLIAIDWSVPGKLQGIDLCREYRASGGKTPLLFLTGKNATVDKVAGLEAGADDYLTKPFESVELLARLRALLRRQPMTATDDVVSLGNVQIDTNNGTVKINGEPCDFYPKELSVLELLMKNPGRAIPSEVILDRVWSSDSEVTADVIRAYVAKVRGKLVKAQATIRIETRKGFGYVLEEDA